jgi:superfamily II DNA or RNA helicase
MEYAEELEYIVTHKGRQDFVINLLKHLKGNTLCLFQLVEKHGKPLHEAAEKTITDRNVYFVYGGTGTDTREEIRALIEDAKNSIVIASYGTFSTGINIRNIHNIVLASPSKSKIRVLQSIGRGLRQSDSKDSVLIFDLADDLTFRNQTNFTLNHFQERIKIYNSEQFNYEISKVKLR